MDPGAGRCLSRRVQWAGRWGWALGSRRSAALGSRDAVGSQASQDAGRALLSFFPPGSLLAAGSAALRARAWAGQAVSLRGWLQACVPRLPASDVRERKDWGGDSLSFS